MPHFYSQDPRCLLEIQRPGATQPSREMCSAEVQKEHRARNLTISRLMLRLQIKNSRKVDRRSTDDLACMGGSPDYLIHIVPDKDPLQNLARSNCHARLDLLNQHVGIGWARALLHIHFVGDDGCSFGVSRTSAIHENRMPGILRHG